MLPNTPGPKLGEFRNGKFKNVKFVQALGSGAHSHVWKVKIDGEVYALKMFRNIRAEEETAVSDAKLKRFGVDLQLLNDQLTPFNCEARAYGRLKEAGIEDIAWKCHGYIAMDEETYSEDVWGTIGLERKDWFSQDTKSDADVADRTVFPIYALVKEFIPNAGELGNIDVLKAHDMAQSINTLHRFGITHQDIQAQNFIDSRFMDFSTAWTVPNIRLDPKLGWDTQDQITAADTNDYFNFDKMIHHWNMKNPDKQCGYRMTNGEQTRRVPRTNVDPDDSDSSANTEEEIPLLERMRDNRYLILASTYQWVEGQPARPQPERNEAPGGPPPPPGPPPAGSPPPGSPPPSFRPRSRLPDPRAPKLTMLWSWTATHKPARPVSKPASPHSPHNRRVDAKRIQEIRKATEAIIVACNGFNGLLGGAAASRDIKAAAQNIKNAIDDDAAGW